MKSSILFSALIIGIILGLPGCAGYNARPLSRIVMQQESRSKETVSFDYQVFTKKDCEKYLDRNVLAKRFQPIQVTITNNSSRRFNFSLKSLNMSCIDPIEVARKVHHSAAARMGAYCFVGGLASIVSVSATIGVFISGAIIVPLLPLALFPIGVLAGIVDGLSSIRANTKLNKDFAKKALHDQIINPHSSINGLIFVPREHMKGSISFTLTDLSSGEQYMLNTAQSTILI